MLPIKLHTSFGFPGNEEVPVKQHLQPKESFQSQTYPGHVFVAYDEVQIESKGIRNFSHNMAMNKSFILNCSVPS